MANDASWRDDSGYLSKTASAFPLQPPVSLCCASRGYCLGRRLRGRRSNRRYRCKLKLKLVPRRADKDRAFVGAQRRVRHGRTVGFLGLLKTLLWR